MTGGAYLPGPTLSVVLARRAFPEPPSTFSPVDQPLHISLIDRASLWGQDLDALAERLLATLWVPGPHEVTAEHRIREAAGLGSLGFRLASDPTLRGLTHGLLAVTLTTPIGAPTDAHVEAQYWLDAWDADGLAPQPGDRILLTHAAVLRHPGPDADADDVLSSVVRQRAL